MDMNTGVILTTQTVGGNNAWLSSLLIFYFFKRASGSPRLARVWGCSVPLLNSHQRRRRAWSRWFLKHYIFPFHLPFDGALGEDYYIFSDLMKEDNKSCNNKKPQTYLFHTNWKTLSWSYAFIDFICNATVGFKWWFSQTAFMRWGVCRGGWGGVTVQKFVEILIGCENARGRNRTYLEFSPWMLVQYFQPSRGADIKNSVWAAVPTPAVSAESQIAFTNHGWVVDALSAG